MIHFEIPKNQSSIIKVIGVGGGGGNAVNYMHSLGIEGVDFIICNTDSQALAQSEISNKIQLGPHLTQGLGAGANPDIGRQAGEESIDDITKILKVNTKMAFITAGMGGGTGTGAAPIIAKVCQELGILTVGIVTTPFAYEGRKRLKQAQDGINALKEYVDTILIISNDKLRQQYGNLPFTEAFSKADDILSTAAKCITDLITVDGRINLDFNDVQTVMKNGGRAILGSSKAEGENRAQLAVTEALNSPLLNDGDIEGAQWILLNITSSKGEHELTLDELEFIQEHVQSQAGHNSDIIFGVGHNPDLGEKIAVTIIATGFHANEINTEVPGANKKESKEIYKLDDKNELKESDKKETAQEPKNVPTAQKDPFAPVLINDSEPKQSPAQGPVYTEPSMTFKTGEKEVGYNLEWPENHPANNQEVPKKAPEAERKNDEIQLIIRNESSLASHQEEERVKIGGRYLTPDEMEERRRFEQQKREFDERVNKLRNQSFSSFSSNSHHEIENIPAYQRQGMELDYSKASSQSHLSNYSVNKDNKEEPINSMNTFLDGEKPD